MQLGVLNFGLLCTPKTLHLPFFSSGHWVTPGVAVTAQQQGQRSP